MLYSYKCILPVVGPRSFRVSVANPTGRWCSIDRWWAPIGARQKLEPNSASTQRREIHCFRCRKAVGAVAVVVVMLVERSACSWGCTVLGPQIDCRLSAGDAGEWSCKAGCHSALWQLWIKNKNALICVWHMEIYIINRQWITMNRLRKEFVELMVLIEHGE